MRWWGREPSREEDRKKNKPEEERGKGGDLLENSLHTIFLRNMIGCRTH